MHCTARPARAPIVARLRAPWLPLCLVALACGRSASPPTAPPRTTRLIAPNGSPSTATLARAQIGGESRYVLAGHPVLTLRSREEVTLPTASELRVPVERPADVAGDVRLDAFFSVRDPSAPSTTLAELREGARVTVAAPPILVHDHTAGSAALVLPVPDALRGQPALLTVLARPLAPSPLVRIETDEVDVPPGARLVFGYGVEEPGWAAGWPPARFRVSGPGDATLFERRLDPAADPRDRRWFDASVDLASVAGRRVRLAFETEALGHAPGATVDRTFAVVANPTIVAPPPAAAGPRNVVLVSLDTLRARSVSAYGCRRATTPGLDRRVAAAGALVRFAVAPVPFTPPSHMSMLTGLEPCAHGVRDLQGALAPERVTLAEALRAAGYATAAFTEDAYLVAGNGFDRGFDVYRENRSEESASPGFAAETFADATSWLSAHATEPFFLFVHTYQVHEPYTPPRGYAGLFTDGDQGDEHQQALANYEREVRYTDDLFGGVLDALETGGLADRTILVVTSDHGEGFAEHFWSGHGFDLHDEALLVPLLVRAPGLVPAGRVVEEQVGLVDLTPTLLDLVGLPPPPDVQGRSFARLLTGRGAAFEERPVVSAALTKSESVRTRRWKYVTAPQGELYYDVAADPLEQRDRAAADPAGVAAARAVLEAAHAACTQWNEAHPRGAAPTGAASGEPAWMINREEVERKLRSLGYAQ